MHYGIEFFIYCGIETPKKSCARRCTSKQTFTKNSIKFYVELTELLPVTISCNFPGTLRH